MLLQKSNRMPLLWLALFAPAISLPSFVYSQDDASRARLLQLVSDIERTPEIPEQTKDDAKRLVELLSEREWNFSKQATTDQLAFIGKYEGRKNDMVLLANGLGVKKDFPVAWLDEQARRNVQDIERLAAQITATQKTMPPPTQSANQPPNQVRMLRPVTVTQQGRTYRFDRNQILDVAKREGNFAWLMVPDSQEQVMLDDRMFKRYIQPPPNGLPAPVLAVDVHSTRPRLPAVPAGLRVRDVYQGGLGEQMGLRRFDIIIAVNDQPVANLEDYSRAAPLRGDGELVLDVRRGGRNLRLDSRVLLPLAPPNQPVNRLDTLSIRGVMDATTGLYLVTFVGEGLGRNLGLEKDMLIFKINDIEIKHVDDVSNVERLAQGRFKIEGEDRLGNSFVITNYNQ